MSTIDEVTMVAIPATAEPMPATAQARPVRVGRRTRVGPVVVSVVVSSTSERTGL